MKKKATKLTSLLLALLLTVGLLPAAALAANEPYAVAIADCDVIGDWDGENVYLYPDTIPADYTQVKFTDLSLEEDGMIASTIGNDYVEGTDTVPLAAGYAFADNDDLTLEDPYTPEDFDGCFLYWIMDDDYEMYYVILRQAQAASVPFTTDQGEVTGVEADAYTVPYVGGTVDLYTVKVPYGTPLVKLTFDEAHIAYAYDADGGYLGSCAADPENGYANGGQTGETTAWVRAGADGTLPPYVQVQTPYDANWSSDALFAVKFETGWAFTATLDDEALTDITLTPEGYTGSTSGAPVTVHSFTISVPEGTESVDFTFTDNVLVYNYDAEGNYLAGWVSDYMTGATAATVTLDANEDGKPDYVQVQTPYDAAYNSTLLYAITFTEAAGGGDEPIAPTDDLMDNIAANYTENSSEWVVMDMAAYARLRPESPYQTAESAKEAYLNAAADAILADGAGDTALAKAVIILTAIGIDPQEIYSGDSAEAVDAVALLNEVQQSASVWNAPYTLAAYNQADFTGTAAYEDALVEALLAAQQDDGSWNEYGMAVDSTANAVMGLAFYADRAEVRAAIDRAVAWFADQMQEDGTFDGGWGANANTCAVVICALAAAGVDPAADARFVQDGVSALDGLLSYAVESNNGFGYSDNTARNDYATEQGFRALVAAARVAADGGAYNVLDFSGGALEPGYANYTNAVFFQVVPEDAAVTLTDAAGAEIAQAAKNSYNGLEAGAYTYTVAREGYNTKTGAVTVEEGSKQTVRVSLTRATPGDTASTVTVTVRVLAHDADTCENSLTYKNDPEAFYSLLEGESYDVTLERNVGTARDALVAALDASGVTYTEKSNGYFSEIGGFEEMSHGPNSGWLYMVNGAAATAAARTATFASDSTMIWWFTDDYSRDVGSEQWTPIGGDTEDDGENETKELPFTDVEGHWALDAIAFVVEHGLFNGTSETTFSPDAPMTRAMLATVLYRLAGEPDVTEGTDFTDVAEGSWYAKAVAWAAAEGIVNGVGDGRFDPDGEITRAQLVTMIFRCAGVLGADVTASTSLDAYTDADEVAAWAREAMAWAVAAGVVNGMTETTLAPNAGATRAQVAVILQRLTALLEK